MTLKSCPISVSKCIANRSLWFFPKHAFLIFNWNKKFCFFVRHLTVNLFHFCSYPFLQKSLWIFICVLSVIVLKNINSPFLMFFRKFFRFYFIASKINGDFFPNPSRKWFWCIFPCWVSFNSEFLPNQISDNRRISSKIFSAFYFLWLCIRKNTKAIWYPATLSCLSIGAQVNCSNGISTRTTPITFIGFAEPLPFSFIVMFHFYCAN